ncbi:uncharacterized protein SPSK_04686 [Sporothrix schenckii 1099-18]|uniref:Uncharacterized protein n=2 Tax=Sporothrix schenckii TaxID=29908 RepID=U7PT54_SPOS1|nr:uncharacterized protein SPSK_04686 [Sporothrix schenckii 1099-18]ERS98792.1 hypothetical protein HMPREF1624_03982 [Sporothrix schenckii ATCC 58251]KJR83609.1 hypothetical protein SPSK_04686 [Sporothrix schenckii 1099-18]
MDALKNLASGGSGAANNAGGAGGAAGGAGGAAGGAGGAAGKQDYGDKAFNFVSKKTGHQVNPETSEKITDGARGAFEKVTGKKVDPKYSN